ncbi:hypothetical protein PISS_a3479 [Pseudoalteromonas issachenkonii]|uniref:Uncharacterized protein n=1 Tax=Pseudoalteromonas issachenkonii TaxID=152297 RepID=A0ABM6N7I0_9GAMM|nr:hypothetical protein PSM_A3062 [Pseudoalteromonas sp. SM9913]ATC92137.1 hypothetical protein PISS_a3479 [Pseudoalteromonas issachenkonii]ATD04642.1 hypothetical protein PTET_a3461 [Pseudoalteromonas tetraodonis]
MSIKQKSQPLYKRLAFFSYMIWVMLTYARFFTCERALK